MPLSIFALRDPVVNNLNEPSDFEQSEAPKSPGLIKTKFSADHGQMSILEKKALLRNELNMLPRRRLRK